MLKRYNYFVKQAVSHQAYYNLYLKEPLKEINEKMLQLKQVGFKYLQRQMMQQVQQVLNELNQLEGQKQVVRNQVGGKIFAALNTKEHYDHYIDLHGQHRDKAIEIVEQRLQEIRMGLIHKKIMPNMNDKRNHVFKIICGAGKHSKGPAVLKQTVLELLTAQNYDFHGDFKNGNFLVRF